MNSAELQNKKQSRLENERISNNRNNCFRKKTALSLEIANKTNSIILSLDSLCVYKEIDIASAKPTKIERGDIVHFGIDEVFPNEKFDVIEF